MYSFSVNSKVIDPVSMPSHHHPPSGSTQRHSTPAMMLSHAKASSASPNNGKNNDPTSVPATIRFDIVKR